LKKHHLIGYFIFILYFCATSLKADIPAWATQQLQLAATLEQCVRETQEWQNIDGSIFGYLNQYKWDDEVEIFYGWTLYYLYSGDESVYESAKGAAFKYLERAGGTFVHGYYPTPFFDTEHTLEGLNMLGALAYVKPDDQDVVTALEDLVEHCGNWVPGYANWFDENTKHFKSVRPGTITVDEGCISGIDWAFNLGFANLAMAAYHSTDNERYLNWVQDYLDGWIMSMERNESENGYYVLPAEVDPITGELGPCSGNWYYSAFEPGWGWAEKGNNAIRDMRGAFLDCYKMSNNEKYLNALKKHLFTLFNNGTGNIPALTFDGLDWIAGSDKVTARMAVDASLMSPDPDIDFDQYLDNWNFNQEDYLMWDYRYNKNWESLGVILNQAVAKAKRTLQDLQDLQSLPGTPDDFPEIREIWGLALSAFGGVLSNRGEMPRTEALYFKEDGSLGLEPGVAAVVASGHDTLKTVYLCNTNSQNKTVQLQANFRQSNISSVRVNDVPHSNFSLTRAIVTIPPGETVKVDLFIFDGDTIPPLNPVAPFLVSKSDQMLHFEWSQPAAAEDGDVPRFYKIYRDGIEVSYQDSLDYKDKDLTEGVQYSYTIIAIDNAGNVSEGVEFTGTTDADMKAPIVETVVAITANTVYVQFNESINEQSATLANNYVIFPAIEITNAALLGPSLVSLTTLSHSQNVGYSLQVNNIKDIATNQNIMSNQPPVSYTYSESLRVENLSKPSYFTRYSTVSDSLYSDRSYVINSVPPQLKDLLWIVTSNDDKTSFDKDFLSFSTNQLTTLYVAYEIEAVNNNLLPSWLAGWKNTGLIIQSNDTDFVCFQKHFLSPQIELGANEGNNSSSMYLILLGPLAEELVPPAAPTGLRISSQ
jgi:hypothetical protein